MQLHFRVYKGLEPVNLTAVFHQHRADFDNLIATGRKAGGFQVEGNIRRGKIHILGAMDNDSVIHIIYIVAFTAIKDLDGFIRTGDLGRTFPVFDRMQRIRKGLAAAMVRDGDRLMSPGSRLLNGILGFGKRIHIGHDGMQVQLHPFFSGGGIFPLFHLSGHDGKGL